MPRFTHSARVTSRDIGRATSPSDLHHDAGPFGEVNADVNAIERGGPVRSRGLSPSLCGRARNGLCGSFRRTNSETVAAPLKPPGTRNGYHIFPSPWRH